MKETLEALIRVQQLEKRLLVLKRRLESLPAELGERESHFSALEAEADQSEGQRKAALSRAQDIENDVRMHEERIEKFEKQAVEARDPSTVQVARHEANRLRGIVSKEQEEALEMLDAAENAEGRRDEARIRVAEALEELNLFRGNLAADEKDVGGEFNKFNDERSGLLAGVEHGARATYEQLLEKYPGRVLAPLKGDSCGGCGTRMVPNDAVRVKAMNGVVRCPACQRMLVTQELWSAAEESAAEA